MKAVVYYLTLPFIYGLSLLPFPLLYGLSDLLYLILYRLIGYRRAVVSDNLRRAFPQKTEAELKLIRERFYRHLCDLFLETFKTLTISRKAMLRHCYFRPEAKALFNNLAAARKSVVLVIGHLGNWEWAGNTFGIEIDAPLNAIYHPLSNPWFDGLMRRMRARFGARPLALQDTLRTLLQQRDEVTVTVFIADQTPHNTNAYWTTFLNQDTAVYWGTEKIARKLNDTVVYARIRKVKRGRYEIGAEILSGQPALTPPGSISELHTRKLEQDILFQPEAWLWSHRRWKHQRPPL